MLWPPLPDYGCFVRWPEEGQGFIHPDDVPLATTMIPSPRVLKRVSFDGTYYHFRYGQRQFRLRPAMWLPIRTEGIDVGDQVQTKGMGLERERFVATVWGMYYINRKGCILYRLMRAGRKVPELFTGEQLQVLTNKSRVTAGNTEYPTPKWDGSGETFPDSSFDE